MASRHTCAKNATTHPGQIILDTQPKQHTKAEKQADDDCLTAARAQKEADALAGLTRLAEMQVQMEATQTQAAEKPKAVKLRPIPKGRQAHTSHSEEPFSLAGCQYTIGNMDGPGETLSLKDQIFDEDESLGGSNIGIPGGTKQKSRKQTLKAAISTVRENIDADVNNAHANNKKGNSLFSCAPPPPSSKADDTEDLVGAFGDEDLDETLEWEVAALMSKSQGKQPVMRKKLTEVIEFSESEISDFPNTDNDLMEVDGLNDESDADIKPEPVDSSSSLKEGKARENAKLEGNIKSEGTSTAVAWHLDLLPGCHEDGKWARVFLPTVFLWLGTQEELWVIADAKLLMACKEIFKVVYPNIHYNVTTSGSHNMLVNGVATSGLLALAIAINFCASNQDSTPAELAELLLVHYAFLYPNPDDIDKSATFHSAFVQELLVTAHLSQILGHADVTVLNTDGLIKHGFVGALGLCAVSLERAFSLLADNTVTIVHEDNSGLPITAWRAHLKMPKTFNKATGKETVSEHTFICGAAKKGEASTELTVSMAWKLLKKPGFERYSSNDSFEDDDDDVDICDFMMQPAMDFVEFSRLK
ncbi:uncharacterized protein EDB91DRAFT_1082851 [Suillus paluster]|uniref:uncharacterized protein n=1 Tax=Suillus paluster TaxID=48578 RepID=UPI001B8863B4|nr:uncharacterized protein EDB91DRAFT_1082851 [Suillus paluster]KAG1738089.1 hypothetical protein EDB91DRAFT_1082851 [Suillus paluster]